MSDLAPFVAAAIRDKVVTDLQVEITELKRQLAVERYKSKTVAITGPNGIPVYATAQFDINGNFDNSPELWKVEFQQQRQQRQQDDQDDDGDLDDNGENVVNDDTGAHAAATTTAATTSTVATGSATTNPTTSTTTTATTSSVCTLNNLYDMEVRIGGICKARFATSLSGNGVTVEGFVNDINTNYNPTQKTGKVSIWFASGIWLTISIGPSLDRDRYASLRDYDLSGPNLLNTLIDICSETNGNDNYNNNNNNSSNGGIHTTVEFVEVSFLISHVNEAMERWNLPTELIEEAVEGSDHDDNENGSDTRVNDSNVLSSTSLSQSDDEEADA